MILLFLTLFTVANGQTFEDPAFLARSWVNGLWDILSPPPPTTPPPTPAPLVDLTAIGVLPSGFNVFGNVELKGNPTTQRPPLLTPAGYPRSTEVLHTPGPFVFQPRSAGNFSGYIEHGPDDMGLVAVDMEASKSTLEVEGSGEFDVDKMAFGDDPRLLLGERVPGPPIYAPEVFPGDERLPQRPVEHFGNHPPQPPPSAGQNFQPPGFNFKPPVPIPNSGSFGNGVPPSVIPNLPAIPLDFLGAPPPPHVFDIAPPLLPNPASDVFTGVQAPHLGPAISNIGNIFTGGAVAPAGNPVLLGTPTKYDPLYSPLTADQLKPFLAPLVHQIGTALEKEKQQKERPVGFGTLLIQDLNGRVRPATLNEQVHSFGTAVAQDLRRSGSATLAPFRFNKGFGSAVAEDLGTRTIRRRPNRPRRTYQQATYELIERSVHEPALIKLLQTPFLQAKPSVPSYPFDSGETTVPVSNALFPAGAKPQSHLNPRAQRLPNIQPAAPKPKAWHEQMAQGIVVDASNLPLKSAALREPEPTHATTGTTINHTPKPDPYSMPCGCVPIEMDKLVGEWSQVYANGRALKSIYTRMQYSTTRRIMMPKCVGFMFSEPKLNKDGFMESELIWFHQDRIYGRKDEHRGMAIKREGNLVLESEAFRIPMCVLKWAQDARGLYTYLILAEAGGKNMCRSYHVLTRHKDPGIEIMSYLREAVMHHRVEADLIPLQRSCRRP